MPSLATTDSGATVIVYPDATAACCEAAERITAIIKGAIAEHGKAVLGLATGATPTAVYAHLVERYKAGTLSFSNVTTYNLDEYYPIGPLDPKSYRFYMHRHLFAHVDLDANRAHVLDGTVPEAAVANHAADYDRWIEADGGLHFQLLGIGRNGHVGFNEPSQCSVPDALALPTRLVELHPVTRCDAAHDFGGDLSLVPPLALTMGVAPIVAARSIVVLAFGAAKSEPFARSVRGPMTAEVPGSLLQAAGSRVTWILDRSAAGSWFST
jgi:glucosamine-6-phosphate deaminase